MSIGRTPDAAVFLDDVTVSRNHALLVHRQDGLYIDDLGSLNGTYVNRRRIESHLLGRRRRDPDRQVQAQLPGDVTRARHGGSRQARHGRVPTARPNRAPGATSGDSRPRKALTIGAVAKILGQEFDDISISKIRYLEDQKLLAPRRTAGGYRLYSQADVERLRAILRMQRDEFLPLRVIRQELATGRLHRPAPERREPEAARGVRRRAGTQLPPRRAARRGRGRRPVPARAAGVRDRRPPSAATAARPTTRPTSRSSARPPSWRASASPGATCASSAPPPTARRRCSSSCSARSCARAARRGARRRSRTSRASPRSAATSSTCCWSATCGASRRPASRRGAGCRMPRVIAQPALIAAPGSGSGGWSPTRTACRAGGRGRPGSRTSRGERRRGRVDRGARDRPRHGRAAPTSAALRPTPASATRGSRRSRARRSSASCGRRGWRSQLRADGERHRGDPDEPGVAARALAAGRVDDARRGPQPPRRGARRDRAGAGRMSPADRDRADRRAGEVVGLGRPGEAAELVRGRARDAARRARRGRARGGRSSSARSQLAEPRDRCPRRSPRRSTRRACSPPTRTALRRAAGKGYPGPGPAAHRRRSTARPTPSCARRRRARSRRCSTPARATGVAVVPFGGGTSVVGGVEPLARRARARDRARPAPAARGRGRPRSR